MLKKIAAALLSFFVTLQGMLITEKVQAIPNKHPLEKDDSGIKIEYVVDPEPRLGEQLGVLLLGREYRSPNDYNAMYATDQILSEFGGVDLFKGRQLTTMTLEEVLYAQSRLNAPSYRRAKAKGYSRVPYSTAVGKYQTIKSTLKWAIDGLGLPLDSKFSVVIQDRIGEYILMNKRPEIFRYLNDEVDDVGAALVALGNEWEAFDKSKFPNDPDRHRDAEKFLRTARLRIRARRRAKEDLNETIT